MVYGETVLGAPLCLHPHPGCVTRVRWLWVVALGVQACAVPVRLGSVSCRLTETAVHLYRRNVCGDNLYRRNVLYVEMCPCARLVERTCVVSVDDHDSQMIKIPLFYFFPYISCTFSNPPRVSSKAVLVL